MLGNLRMRMVTTFYRRAWLFGRDLEQPITGAQPRLPVRVAILEEAELDDYLAFRRDERRTAIEARIARGHLCFAAWHESRIVHAAWAAPGAVRVPYLQRELVLAPDECLVYDSCTAPAFRRSGAARARMMELFAYWRARGFRRCYAVLARENLTGERTLRAGGYRPVGRYLSIRLPGVGSWCRGWPEPGAKLPALRNSPATRGFACVI